MRLLKRIFTYIVVGAYGFGGMAQTQATIDIVEDVSVYYKQGYDAGNQNYSLGANLKVGTGTSGGSPTKNRVYMRLDLSGIPNNSVISEAYLELYSIQAQSTSNNKVWLRKVTVPWVDTTITWNNQPFDILSPDFLTTDPFIPAGSDGLKEVDITDWIVEALTAGQTDFSFLMCLDDESGGYVSQKFASYENATIAQRPKFVVTYFNNEVFMNSSYEEPAAIFTLLGTGLNVKIDEGFLVESGEDNLEYEIRNRNNEEIISRTGSGLSIDYPFISIQNGSFYINPLMQYMLIIYNSKGEKRYVKFKQ